MRATLPKKMSETTKAERKESSDKINAAYAAYGTQRDRLLKQGEDAADLADSLEIAYTQALAAYLPTPEAQARLQALSEAYHKAVSAAEKSNKAASGFASLRKKAKEALDAIRICEPTIPLRMWEDRVFGVNTITTYTNGHREYGLHEAMLNADAAYAKALALAAEAKG
jgi:hypothetical protein